MDIITIDGKDYDPYFILDVTKDDSSEHITRSFRAKVKKYHPDKYTDKAKKKKYEKYFKILSESYQYIKNKRQSSRINKNSHKTRDEKITQKGLEEFNKDFSEKCKGDPEFRADDPNRFGYGDDYDRLKKEDDYEKFKTDIYNPFGDKKFSADEFNDMFEYIKQKDEDYDKVVEKSLIHKTTDGFRGYNSSDFGNCALVSSFNGLMVTGDRFGESGVGYWGSGYSDYKYSYKRAKNPSSIVIVPKDTVKKNPVEKITQQEMNEYKRRYNTKIDGDNSQVAIDDIIYEQLVEKEKEDEALVKKFISQYDEQHIASCLAGNLDRSRTYKETLDRQYIKRH